MPETTPLIKAALNLRVGAGFDVYMEIAGQCGYDNSNYFSDSFKKIVGVSPLKYRKQINK